MILVDANLLLYAYNPSSGHHQAARRWLEEALSKPEPIGLTWVVLLAFLRIGTNSRLFPYPLATSEAAEIVHGWLRQPQVAVLDPTEGHWAILSGLLTKARASGPLVMDAHLAALAIEHGATLCTTDRDFARFPGLKIMNPLETE